MKIRDTYADLEDILENNKRWVNATREQDAEFFQRLGRGQRPKYFYIGCADSRVPANEIMGLGPGEVFVHRNVANLVVGTDVNLLACLQFAIDRLDVDHIIGELSDVVFHVWWPGVCRVTRVLEVIAWETVMRCCSCLC